MRQVYLAATGQNRGKTTAALGLLNLFVDEGLRTGFMKPVGQRTVLEDGVPADEDAVLMRAVFGLPERLEVMSPVHIPRGFTKAYIAGDVVDSQTTIAARLANQATATDVHAVPPRVRAASTGITPGAPRERARSPKRPRQTERRRQSLRPASRRAARHGY